MPPAPKSTAEQGQAPSTKNLWIGNLSPDVTEADLQAIFSKHGEIDSITAYAARTYGFVYFKNLDDAKAAKEALQGYVLRGNPMKIEFAKPAKPCKSLWVAGISQSISREELEEEFLKFGKIQEFKFHRDRNTAYIDYSRLEDASEALKNMNGKRIGGDQLRVDFLRSQPTRREQWSESHDARGQFYGRVVGAPDARWVPPNVVRNYPEPIHAGSKRPLFQLPGGRKGDGQPSNILWISYPPSVHIDEDMLHNAMILFGEIERIKTFADRNYSFVEFRSVDEARLAKEGLQGKLFNDPRIMIQYSSSDLVSGKEVGYYPGMEGPRPDMYFSEAPYRPGQVEVFGPNRPLLPTSVPTHLQPRGIRGSDSMLRPLGPQGSFEIPASELSDLAAIHNLPEAGPHNLIRGSDWRRSSPVPGVLPSPSAGSRVLGKSASSGWDVFDATQVQRESKRPRVDDAVPAYDAPIPLKKMSERGLALEDQYGVGPLGNGGASGSLANLQGKNRLSPVDGRVMAGVVGQRYSDDHIWRGIIAKGGSPVCHARCVPLGEGVEFDIPEVVNCSARTGLDLLTKHYADAVGFSIVFFLPDSEEDFASYTEFLRYLGSKNRAGVAKFDDGTTLFLVPPSDFLAKVLNVKGPERLYGVVLKFGQHGPSGTPMQPPSLPPHYVDAQQITTTTQSGYNIMSQEERVLQPDYKRVPHEESKPPLRTPGPLVTNSLPVHSVPPVSTAAGPPSGVTLTPELIATLASLLPTNSKSSAPESVPPPSGSSMTGPGLASDRGLSQGWKHEYHTPEQTSHLVQPLGSQYSIQAAQHVPQVQAYQVESSTSTYPVHGVMGSSQMQDGTFNLHPQGAVSSKPLPSAGHWQPGHVAYSQQVDQQYQHVMPQDSMKAQEVVNTTDSLLFGSSVQQSTNSVTLPNQVHGAHIPQRSSMPLSSEMALAHQVHQIQSSQTPHLGAGQITSEAEKDKNERYQTTLLFAANLLSKIQQQQPPGTQTGQGSGSH